LLVTIARMASSKAFMVEADHVNIWRTVDKLRRRHGLLMSGEPREPGYRVEGLRWEAKRMKSAVRAVETTQPH